MLSSLLIGSVGSLHFGARLQVTASTAAGDSFTFSTMLGMQHVDWVQTLLVPWIIFFALAAVASAFSILSKLHFFVGKMRSNFARRSHLSASAVTVNDALYQNDFNTHKFMRTSTTRTQAGRCAANACTLYTGTWSSGSARRVSRRGLVWPQPRPHEGCGQELPQARNPDRGRAATRRVGRDGV